MKRLWSTLACLGVTRMYITGAEKVEKVYFASHALKPERFYPELIHGRLLPCPLSPTWAVTKYARAVVCHHLLLQTCGQFDC